MIPTIPRINGLEMPRRIWLMDEGGGDICWANEPDPTGDCQVEAVEYIRADVAWKLAGPKRSASTMGRRGRRTSPTNNCRHPAETKGGIWRCEICGASGGDL